MDSTGQKEQEFKLIRDILDGKHDRYRTLVDRYSPMVFHIVRRFEKDDEDIEELSQEIFVKAYEKLESFNMKSKFSSWLYTLAYNHCMDYAKNIRRSNSRFSEMEPDFVENRMAATNTPYEELEMSEWKELLKQALSNLADDYAEPFLLKYRDGLSYKVMSERTGVGVSALKVRVHRARKELKTLIEKQL